MYQGRPEENPGNKIGKLLFRAIQKEALCNCMEDEELFAQMKQHFISGAHTHLRLQNMTTLNWLMLSKFPSTQQHTPQHKQSQGPDLGANGQTHIREVPCHPTALAVLVPQRGPFTGPEAMWRQATAGAGAARTVPLDVALDPTEDTGGAFLLTWHRDRKEC